MADQKKYTDDELNNQVNKSKMELLDKLFNLYPFLGAEKQEIMQKCVTEATIDTAIISAPVAKVPIVKKNNTIVLEQVVVNQEKYFRDKFNGLWNNDADLVGVFKGYSADNTPVCELFSKKYNTNIDLKKILETSSNG